MNRERVDDINKCGTPASIGEYLEDNPFRKMVIPTMKDPRLDRIGELTEVGKILEHALYKPTNLNFTQYQLKLQTLSAKPRAYAVLLRIMEIRFGLERLDLE